MKLPQIGKSKMNKKSDTDINNYIKQIEDLKKENDEWKSKYLRALADYQNLEKRVQTARIGELKTASKNILIKVLPILDTLEKALKVTSDQGIILAVKQFNNILEDEKVIKIDVIGKRFDPLQMECVEVAGFGMDDTVTEEVRSGYMIYDQILRVAQVKVGRKKTDNKEQITENKNIG